jgi:DNA-binding response OmpR family regulator
VHRTILSASPGVGGLIPCIERRTVTVTVTETHVDLDPADVALAERDRQVSKADVATLRNLEYGIAQLQAQLAHKTLLRDELLERLAMPEEEMDDERESA